MTTNTVKGLCSDSNYSKIHFFFFTLSVTFRAFFLLLPLVGRLSVSVRLWPTTRTKSSSGSKTRFGLIIAWCECKHGMWFKIIRFAVGVNSVRGNRRHVQRRLSRTHWLQLCSSVYPEGNQVKAVPDIHSTVPLIREPSAASLHVTQVPSHMNFHNVVWSDREFFLLKHLANLISWGNKGRVKVGERRDKILIDLFQEHSNRFSGFGFWRYFTSGGYGLTFPLKRWQPNSERKKKLVLFIYFRCLPASCRSRLPSAPVSSHSVM